MVEDNSRVLVHRLHNNRYAHTPKGRYFRYRQRAKEKGRNFQLTQEEFTQLFNSNCHYCGTENARGIDRINSNRGYTKCNTLPCCSTCNYMKKNYSYEIFITQINKIANNLT